MRPRGANGLRRGSHPHKILKNPNQLTLRNRSSSSYRTVTKDLATAESVVVSMVSPEFLKTVLFPTKGGTTSSSMAPSGQ